VTVTAKDLKFGQTEITVPADEAFDLVLDNQESAPHNVAIYTDESASTKISVGEIFSGPAQKTQSVPAMAAGTYFFRCDVHPDMKGTVVAE
jgi:plastocyanin